MSITRIWPEDVYRTYYSDIPGAEEPSGNETTYAQVVRIDRPGEGKSIHVAGTFAADTGRNVIGVGDMGAQVAGALENIRRSLDAAGASVSDIVRMKYYVTEMDEFVRAAPARLKQFFDQEALPASTAVEVKGLALPDALIEIEAYAEVASAA